MPLLSKKEIAELHQINQENCISIFIPTHRAGKEVLQEKDALSLKVQLQDVKKKLAKKGIHKTTINTITAPVQQLIDNTLFWRQQSDGLAIFIADNYFKTYTLPIYFEAFNYIANAFYLKPLMPLFVGDGRFYLMNLEIGKVKLHECTQHSITEISIDDLIPENIQDSVGYDYEDKNLQFRTQQSGAVQAIFHGQEAATGKRKNEIKTYFRAINDGIKPLLKDEKTPLIIASQDYLFDIYKEANTYSNLYDKNINTNLKVTNILDLHELAWEKISPIFDQKRKDKIARFLEVQGTGKTAIGIERILPKAFQGKIDTLFCENLADIFGSYKLENDTVSVTETEENDTTISLMNLAAIKTFLTGGAVYLLDKETMPNQHSKINALYRY
ncbi:hypothetical protein [Thalassobellus suaedae]|uniref:Uncharacterized protein n=1 Tax=Thalassobellus suaedae TaxID=3074124 RepID=A0ABY9Y4D4_9FLAO|nr:hypothetical protein RHP51_11290 [Flavobacteriaceae bacterium HL-DH14]WNH13099.1 hypothetical protein RHP49_02335 [Flavobacteriaceae bacterium HL-DH10]